MWRCGPFILDTAKPLVMGILNVTPDSFSDGGMHDSYETALAHAYLLKEEGAHVIDVGGESTRPGSAEISCEEELARVVPVVAALAEEGLVVSIDTRHARVAAACVDAGAAIINDVTGFRDPAMIEVGRNSDAGVIVMHMKGEPCTMQEDPTYDDVVDEVATYLITRARELEGAGIEHERICIDPGPGFGKTPQHNLELLAATGYLCSLGYPLLAAYSRKGFIGALTGVDEAAKRVAGSLAVALLACERGAQVVRVHDVGPTVEALRMLEALRTMVVADCATPLEY